jgi:hypothetical protein
MAIFRTSPPPPDNSAPDDQITLDPVQCGAIAQFRHRQMTAITRAMPDCTSAVLFAMCWVADVQSTLRGRRRAGQTIARVSASRLAQITGRHVRTIRNSLAKLQNRGAIEKAGNRPGVTAAYRLCLGVAATHSAHGRRPACGDES